jgi:PIN domain nuclease of toxin-antitoxin system
MKYIVDTHALIWFLEGNSRLGVKAKAILSDLSSELILPAIALAESVWIVSRGKTSIPSASSLLNITKSDLRVFIYPLDIEVIEESTKLITINEMHDRQIVSTALVIQNQGHQVALITHLTYLKIKTRFGIGFGAAPQLRATPSNSLN